MLNKAVFLIEIAIEIEIDSEHRNRLNTSTIFPAILSYCACVSSPHLPRCTAH